jgi:hypothetical protein
MHGAALVNQNNRRHGAYAPRLSPEDRELSEELRAIYESDLAPLSASDRLSIRRLAIAEAKLMSALAADAPPAALMPLHRMLSRELEALKATRELRGEAAGRRGTSPAEVVADILRRIRDHGLQGPPPEDQA